MNILIALLTLFSSMAAYSGEVESLVLIKAKQSQSNVAVELFDGQLSLGASTISNWYYAKPECHDCDLVVERKHYPDGPNISLKLTSSDSSYKWFILDSWQKSATLNLWSIVLDSKSMVIASADNSVSLHEGESKELEGCEVTAVYLNFPVSRKQATNISKPNQAHISNDRPQQHFQLLVECLPAANSWFDAWNFDKLFQLFR